MHCIYPYQYAHKHPLAATGTREGQLQHNLLAATATNCQTQCVMHQKHTNGMQDCRCLATEGSAAEGEDEHGRPGTMANTFCSALHTDIAVLLKLQTRSTKRHVTGGAPNHICSMSGLADSREGPATCASSSHAGLLLAVCALAGQPKDAGRDVLPAPTTLLLSTQHHSTLLKATSLCGVSTATHWHAHSTAWCCCCAALLTTISPDAMRAFIHACTTLPAHYLWQTRLLPHIHHT